MKLMGNCLNHFISLFFTQVRANSLVFSYNRFSFGQLTRYNLFLFFVIFLIVPSSAQTSNKGIIKGRLVDDEDKPLPYVSILLKHAGDSTIYKTVLTDNNGAFVLELIRNGNYYVEFRMVGFAKNVKSNLVINEANSEIDLGTQQLFSAPNLLKEVTISAEIPFIERQLDKIVINLDNNIISAGSSVMEVMEKLPGVQVNNGFILNGKSGVNLFIDGKATFLSFADLSNMLSGLPSSTIQKIELIANPSAKYDAAGSAGIINIVKKKNRKDGFNGSLNSSLSKGEYGRFNGGFNLSFKNKKYNLFLNNSFVSNKTYIVSDGSRDFYEDDVLTFKYLSKNRHHSTLNSYTPTFGADWYLSKKTTLSVSGTAGIRQTNGHSNAYSDLFNSNRNKINGYDFINNNSDRFYSYSSGLHLAHQVDSLGGEISVDFDYSNFWNDSNQEIGSILNDANGNFLNSSELVLAQGGDLNIYSAKADYTKSLKRNLKLEAGWKSSLIVSNNNNDFYNRINEQLIQDPGKINYFRYSENINSLYVNLNHQYKQLTIQLGLRGEQTIGKGEQHITNQQITQNYFQLFPTAFFNYKISEKHRINVNLGRRTDRPAYAQLNPLRRIINATSYTQGNPDLQPQLSYNSQIVYSYNNAFFVNIGYSLYKDFIVRYVAPDAEKGVAGDYLTNIDNSDSYDLGFSYSKKLTGWWNTINNFNLSYKSFNGNIKDYDFENQGMSTFYFMTNNSFPVNEKITLESLIRYAHKGQNGASVFKSRYTLGLGLRKLVFASRGSLALNMNDLLLSEGMRWSTYTGSIRDSWDVNSDTRVASLNFTYRFGKGQGKRKKSSNNYKC